MDNDISEWKHFLDRFSSPLIGQENKASCAPIGRAVWGSSPSQRHVAASHKASLPVAYFRFSSFQRVLSGVGVIIGDGEPQSECAVKSELGNSGAKCQGPQSPLTCAKSQVTCHVQSSPRLIIFPRSLSSVGEESAD